MYQVIFPDGRASTPITAEKVRELYGEGKIPEGAIVEHRVRLTEFILNDTPATDRQKQYAKSLSIDFHPNVSRSALSKLIDATVSERDQRRLDQMFAVSEREMEARNLLIAEMEGEGHIWLCNASEQQMVEELESRDVANILISMEPDVISALVAVHEEGMTAELAAEVNSATPTVNFSQHIQKHELKNVLISIMVGIPDEPKPRLSRRLHS